MVNIVGIETKVIIKEVPMGHLNTLLVSMIHQGQLAGLKSIESPPSLRIYKVIQIWQKVDKVRGEVREINRMKVASTLLVVTGTTISMIEVEDTKVSEKINQSD